MILTVASISMYVDYGDSNVRPDGQEKHKMTEWSTDGRGLHLKAPSTNETLTDFVEMFKRIDLVCDIRRTDCVYVSSR